MPIQLWQFVPTPEGPDRPFACDICNAAAIKCRQCHFCWALYCESCYCEVFETVGVCVCNGLLDKIGHPIIEISKELRRSKFACINSLKGCPLVCKYSEIEGHQDACLFTEPTQRPRFPRKNILATEINLAEDGQPPHLTDTPISQSLEIDRKLEKFGQATIEEFRLNLERVRKAKEQVTALIKIALKNEPHFDSSCKSCHKFSCRSQLQKCPQCTGLFCYNCKSCLLSCDSCKVPFCGQCLLAVEGVRLCAACDAKDRGGNKVKHYAKRSFVSKIASSRFVIKTLDPREEMSN